MYLEELKKKTLGLIEEVSPDNEYLTEDPDIATKINDVINQVMYEIIRIKKLPKYVKLNVMAGELVDFDIIERECGYEVFQINTASGVAYESKASGTVLKILESGTLELDIFVYPERITEKTKDNYEFELSPDVLEIMPYGIAADLLKSDVSSEYGAVYANRYESMLQRLDPRYKLSSIRFEGGVDI